MPRRHCLEAQKKRGSRVGPLKVNRSLLMTLLWEGSPPCVGQERRAWSASNLLDWIPNRGVQGEHSQKILRSPYILARQESKITDAVSSCSSTTTMWGRDECLFGGEHSPFTVLTGVVPSKQPVSHRVRGWWSPQHHRTSVSDHCVLAAAAATADRCLGVA